MLVMVSVGGVFVTWLATLCLEKPCMCSIAVTHATFSQLYCKLPRPPCKYAYMWPQRVSLLAVLDRDRVSVCSFKYSQIEVGILDEATFSSLSITQSTNALHNALHNASF